MNKWIYILFLSLLTHTVFALEQPTNIEEGVQAYDWQTCFQSKSNDCLNGCVNSDDIHCSDNCKSDAKDKCISLGVSPPD